MLAAAPAVVRGEASRRRCTELAAASAPAVVGGGGSGVSSSRRCTELAGAPAVVRGKAGAAGGAELVAAPPPCIEALSDLDIAVRKSEATTAIRLSSSRWTVHSAIACIKAAPGVRLAAVRAAICHAFTTNTWWPDPSFGLIRGLLFRMCSSLGHSCSMPPVLKIQSRPSVSVACVDLSPSKFLLLK